MTTRRGILKHGLLLPAVPALLRGAPAVAAAPAHAPAKPLKVFILAGQSNMEGHAEIRTFDYIGDDPATAPLLRQMRGADGKPAVCRQVWISYLTGIGEENGEGFGKLTAGYGSRDNPAEDGGKIGPEFTFGLTMEAALGEPVLIIKTAWGGKSLHTDFRPPSAGPYVQTAEDLKRWKEKPEEEKEQVKATGAYYRLMTAHVKRVTADIRRIYPDYDEKQGWEIAGFVWLQGFNDLVAGNVYPSKPGQQVNDYSQYSAWLADFIRDTRKDFAAPQMPFVIGVLGVDGARADDNIKTFRRAMAAPALLPEFAGNVAAVETAPFWSEELGAIAAKKEKVSQMAWYLDTKHKDHANADGTMTDERKREYLKEFEATVITPAEAALWERGASNAGYHYLGCAKTFALMGKAFAESALGMMPKRSQP
ncbi:MAG: hypothetical protein EOP86_22405 [Verrucomicrobiaceae bacterium]|nr:MAG: hypothetical protein EOP86_22405 [Verrucomicrobiaceae bacterium]